MSRASKGKDTARHGEGKGYPRQRELQSKEQGSLTMCGPAQGRRVVWRDGRWPACGLAPSVWASPALGQSLEGGVELPPSSPSPSKGPQGEAALPARSLQTSVSSSEEEELRELASLLSSSPQTAREWRIPLLWSSSRRRCCGLFGLWC